LADAADLGRRQPGFSHGLPQRFSADLTRCSGKNPEKNTAEEKNRSQDAHGKTSCFPERWKAVYYSKRVAQTAQPKKIFAC
jgi:hypothetical protein